LRRQNNMQDSLELKVHNRHQGLTIFLARCTGHLVLCLLSIWTLCGCSQQPVKPSVLAIVDTQGAMPLMRDPKLMPSLTDPKIAGAKGELSDLQSELNGLDRDGKWQEALDLAKAFVAKQKQNLGGSSYFVGIGDSYVVRFAAQVKDMALAESAAREELAIKRRYLGEGCVETAATLDTLANIMLSERNVAAAANVVNECWTKAQKQPPSLAARIYYLSTLSTVARAQGQNAQAAKCAAEAVALKMPNPEFYVLQPTIYDLLTRAARCHLDVGRYDQAQQYLGEYVRVRFDKTMFSDEDVAQMLVACAQAAELRQDRKQAQAAIQTAGQLLAGGRVSPATQLLLAQYRRNLQIN